MYPKLNDVKRWLETFGFEDISQNMLAAYVVGSVARKTEHSDSDLDIAVIVPEDKIEDDILDINTDILNALGGEVQWAGSRVDIQVYSDQDPRLNGYSKIPLKASTKARL